MLLESFRSLLVMNRGRRAANASVTAASWMSRTAGIPTFRQSLPELSAELARARRYQRPLAIVVLSLAGDEVEASSGHPADSGGNGRRATSQAVAPRTAPLTSLLFGAVLRDALRETDIVSYSPVDDEYVVLLPDAKEWQGEHAIQRLAELCRERMSITLLGGVAEFPKDGLTLEDLVHTARTACRNSSLGEIT